MQRTPFVMTAVVCATLCGSVASAQQPPPQRPPAPEGRRLIAADGDVVVLNDDDRVRIVRRREAQVRVVVDQPSGTIIVLAHWTVSAVRSAEGIADWAWRFSRITLGQWPFESPWEGPAVVEESDASPLSQVDARVVLETSQGSVHFISGTPWGNRPPASAAATIVYSGGGGTVGGVPFDQMQQREIEVARHPLSRQGSVSIGRVPDVAISFMGLDPPGGGTAAPAPLPRPPSGSSPYTGFRKVHHVDPELPEELRRAGVMGWSIVELTLDDDGTVTAARVLRSIPGTDEIVLAAVKQWRYEMGRIPCGVLRPVTISVAVPLR